MPLKRKIVSGLVEKFGSLLSKENEQYGTPGIVPEIYHSTVDTPSSPISSEQQLLARQTINDYQLIPHDINYVPDAGAPAKHAASEMIIEDEAFEAESTTIWPKPGITPRVTPLTSDDFVQLQSQWEGGCILSVHDSGLADNWLDQHYEHECLVNLRANKIGGPIPAMLSVHTPALSIFGPISPQTMEIADELAKLSGFPIIIRPVAEDPSAPVKYSESSNLDGKSSGSQINEQITVGAEGGNSRRWTSMQPSKGLSDRDHRPHQQPEDDDGRHPPPPPEPDLCSREITHDTDIALKILVNGEDRGDFVELETSVKFYPIPNEKEVLDSGKHLDRPCKPKIEANIVRLKTRGSPSVRIDSATGSLGFLAHERSYLRLRDFVPLGHNKPSVKFTYIANEQRAKTYNVTSGLTGGNPMVAAAFTYANMDSATTQAAEDTPAPRWVVDESEATDENWNSAIVSYSTLNAKIYRWPQGTIPIVSMFHDMQLDAKYGMSVDVDVPIRKDAPKVSFVYRHQIHCWVAVNSKARRRGIIVVAANYIPDICTEHRLWIQEYPTVNLVHKHSDGNIPEGDASAGPENTSEGIFSFATATTQDAPTSPKYLKIFRRAQGDAGKDIPIHTHINRGWDHTNLQWQRVLWPDLNCKIQPLRGEAILVERLNWRGDGQADNIIQAQGSSTAMRAGSSIADKEQTNDPGSSIKRDKGKAKQVT